MGAKGKYESVVRLFVAFTRQKTWRQVELATHVELTVKALKSQLEAMQGSGIPLESDSEGSNVYWSMPRTWGPGGCIVEQDDLPLLVHALSRLEGSEERDPPVSA